MFRSIVNSFGVDSQHTERGEEPSVLSARVALLKSLLDGLLGLLTLGDLSEGLVGDNALQTLKLEGVSCWHQVVVVDDLDEWLDLAALVLAGLGHAAGDLLWVALDTGDDGVWVRPLLGTFIVLLDDDDLLASLTAGENDGDLQSVTDKRNWSLFC